ncbi:2OG-Fe(II) oxygenase family protein [Rhodopila sp.]|jgi:hypothetical protein|uniref:2OG-Fe(II) oxygenase family protein n=1 Tax=Rhodopila sp. TaxID=2480087 RepID=UPI002BDF8C1C|nr:2OG-Fe(II) oxygenase [Rhodopila sp.]HVZ08151.1 2OG-Fe(II) oxygenase [Rhodopila sp.]
MPLLRLDALQEAPLTRDPFQFTVVRDFVTPRDASAIRDAFPRIAHAGLLPVAAVAGGPAFDALIQALRAPAFSRALSEKFGLDLVDRSLMITVRGRCAERDGRIHTDSICKLATALLYFNDTWDADGGRLRLLRRPDDLDDMLAEVPPDAGTLVAFQRSDKSWHGHEPFVGVRRYVMINWMASTFAAKRELFRHHVSSVAKRTFRPAAGHV